MHTVKLCIFCKQDIPASRNRYKRKFCNHNCSVQWRLQNQPKLHHNKEWLEKQYIGNKLSFDTIAKLAGVGHTSIYKMAKKFGIKSRIQPRSGKLLGSEHYGWKGGTYTVGGYRQIYAPEFPGRKQAGRYALEHHLVIWKNTGHIVTKEEVVHHRNGERLDNKIENLQIFPTNGAHITFEQDINTFTKQLLWGDKIQVSPEIKKQLFELFENFIKN